MTYTAQDFVSAFTSMVSAMDSYGRIAELQKSGYIEIEFDIKGNLFLEQADFVRDMRRPKRREPMPRLMYISWPGIKDSTMELVRDVAPGISDERAVKAILKAKFDDVFAEYIGERGVSNYARETKFHGIKGLALAA